MIWCGTLKEGYCVFGRINQIKAVWKKRKKKGRKTEELCPWYEDGLMSSQLTERTFGKANLGSQKLIGKEAKSGKACTWFGLIWDSRRSPHPRSVYCILFSMCAALAPHVRWDVAWKVRAEKRDEAKAEMRRKKSRSSSCGTRNSPMGVVIVVLRTTYLNNAHRGISTPPRIQVTIKKHPSRVMQPVNPIEVILGNNAEGWIPAPSRNQRNVCTRKSSKERNPMPNQVGKGGIIIVFKSTESPCLITVDNEAKENQSHEEKESGTGKVEGLAPVVPIPPTSHESPTATEEKETMVVLANQATKTTNQTQAQAVLNSIAEFLEEGNILEEEEFTKEELDAYLALDDPQADEEMEAFLDNSFQSLNTNNSVMKLMQVMDMRQEEMSTIGSSERKGNETEGDTASSSLKRNKTTDE